MAFKKMFEHEHTQEQAANILEEGDYTLRGVCKPKKEYLAFTFGKVEDFEYVKAYISEKAGKNVKNFDGNLLVDIIKKIEEYDEL